MAKDRRPNKEETTAQLHHDIETGVTGDKKPGFDPAIAPLDTDAEAGGIPLSPQEVHIDRAHKSPADTDLEGSDADAMRSFESRAERRHGKRRFILPAIVLLILLVLAIIAFLIV